MGVRQRLRCAAMVAACLGAIVVAAACGQKPSATAPSATPEETAGKKVKVGLALGYGGVGDMGFNDLQYNGLVRASKSYDIEIAYKVPAKDNVEETRRILEELLSEGCDIIIGAGYLMPGPLAELAPRHEDVRFILLDAELGGVPNLTSVLFSQHEGSFVVGWLAARFSKTKKVAFLGGSDIPVLKAFEVGFAEGVARADPKVALTVDYCSRIPDFSGFDDANRGYELAKALYAAGVDVVFAAAGATNPGIIMAARDAGLYVIGVDSNQDGLAEGHVLTSMLKLFDNAVFDMIGLFLEGELEGDTTYRYGYGNAGVGITDMKYTRTLVGESLISELERVEAMIVSGEIVVTDALAGK